MRLRMVISLIISSVSLFLLAPSFAEAGGQVTTRLRKSELKDVPLLAGISLKITITSFSQGYLHSESGNAIIEAQVENLSPGFVNFSPHRLSFVGSDNEQVDILSIKVIRESFPAVERRIAPLARIKESYRLTDKVEFPARLYYEDKLLAVISD